MNSTESRFVTGPSDILFGSVYVRTFQPITFTDCGSEGVNPFSRQQHGRTTDAHKRSQRKNERSR